MSRSCHCLVALSAAWMERVTPVRRNASRVESSRVESSEPARPLEAPSVRLCVRRRATHSIRTLHHPLSSQPLGVIEHAHSHTRATDEGGTPGRPVAFLANG